ncbi:MAG: D-aminoacyl-tRNA deacylase [Elusimicrobia bacterium]|nr:D-aminoacyl-tRNA deacylase [Elusimicrobiota bacterium]
MRALIQRVSRASVALPGGECRKTAGGLLIYLGVGKNDSSATARKLAEKCAHLRIFSDPAGKFNLSIIDAKGEALVISQFTLFGDVKGGRRPDFTAAAPPEPARRLYQEFASCLSGLVLGVKTGEFGAHMGVESLNDGPVTLMLDTDSF